MPIRSGVSGLDKVFILNETGSLIWSVLKTPSRLETVVEAVETKFAVDRERAEADAVAFLEALDEARLIDRS